MLFMSDHKETTNAVFIVDCTVIFHDMLQTKQKDAFSFCAVFGQYKVCFVMIYIA